ncbi:hypothetical protein BKI51_02465 [Alphaproteobacteria bacterium AO1-B]|nr:hypothetical protein BKI51_02465 [Alphaproteobacteria bacterium AO1-B]
MLIRFAIWCLSGALRPQTIHPVFEALTEEPELRSIRGPLKRVALTAVQNRSVFQAHRLDGPAEETDERTNQ